MSVPEPVRELMWEYEGEPDLADERWQLALVERIMLRGGWEAMLWLVRSVGRDRLRAFLGERGRRVLPPRELRFWALVCRVPDEVCDAWVAEARERERAWRG